MIITNDPFTSKHKFTPEEQKRVTIFWDNILKGRKNKKMLNHLKGDLSCPYCDNPPDECQNCGGIIHYEVNRLAINNFNGIPEIEEITFCDNCTTDYIV